MTGLNHALVGGLIAKFVPLPFALPLAFLSHFALDALPHYGIPNATRSNARPWQILFVIDTILTVSLLVFFVAINRYDMALCSIAAMAPDIVWLKRIIKNPTLEYTTDANWLTRFHHNIQKYEQPWGLYVEIPLAGLLLVLIILG